MNAFFYHYNKPLSQQRGVPTITIHFKGACHFVEGLTCTVPTKSRINKSQPRFVMAGKANKITIKNRVATIS
jgi:hypothetical protein